MNEQASPNFSSRSPNCICSAKCLVRLRGNGFANTSVTVRKEFESAGGDVTKVA